LIRSTAAAISLSGTSERQQAFPLAARLAGVARVDDPALELRLERF
jgi:hypothetical protein